MERYILKYLQDSTQDEWKKRYYDYLKMHLDNTLWSYGAHMGGVNIERTLDHTMNYVIPRKNTLNGIYGILQRAINRKLYKKKNLNNQIVLQAENIDNNGQLKYRVLCAFHLPWLLPDDAILQLNDVGIQIDFIDDATKEWSGAISRLLNWYKQISLLPFNEIIKDRYVAELKNIYEQIRSDFEKTNYDAVIVHTAAVLETKVLIDIFRELHKISIELLHGVPGSNPYTEASRVDYYMVYGDKIKENCIAFGCDKDRVCVVGDCKYKDFENDLALRCDLSDVLVTTSSTCVDNQYEWYYELFPNNDRSLLITYLYSIENILKKNGVTHARLRPHPQVNKDWLRRYVDMEFYEMDYLDLSESLNKASICIGQNSTVVFEALNHGVSYLVYEPGDGKLQMTGGILPPPYDGSDPNIKIANTEEQLDSMIKERYRPSPDLGKQYMEPFKPEVIRDILEKNRQIKATKSK